MRNGSVSTFVEKFGRENRNLSETTRKMMVFQQMMKNSGVSAKWRKNSDVSVKWQKNGGVSAKWRKKNSAKISPSAMLL
jgi:hypothetical protein